MPRKQTGSVEKRGGRFRARLGREVLGTFDTEDEADRKIIAAQVMNKGVTPDMFCIKGEKYMKNEELLARTRRGNSKMWQKEVSLWARHIRTSKIYRMNVKSIQREHVQDLLEKVAQTRAVRIEPKVGGGFDIVETDRFCGERTIKRVRSRLSHFFDRCRGLKSNPALRCPIPNTTQIKIRHDSDQKPHLHADEVVRLFDLLEMTDEHRAVYAFGIYAGLRIDEIVGLRWENILRLDSDDPELAIQFSYDAPTKTQSSQRGIPMLPQLVKELRAYRASLPSTPIAGVVFPGKDGSVRSIGYSARWADKRYRNENGEWRVRVGYRTLAGIRKHILFRHVRHTCATHLLKGTFTHGHEWPIEKVSQLLGHEDVSTTIEHYASREVDRLHSEVAKGKRKAEREQRRVASARLLEDGSDEPRKPRSISGKKPGRKNPTKNPR